MNTPELIAALARDLAPVRRLRPPLVRAACWFVLALATLAALALGHGIRADLAQRLHDPVFAASLAFSLLTGILATVAAFQVSLADRSRRWLLLPLPAFALWVSNIGYQCLTQWVALDPGDATAGETARCFATLVLAGLPLSLLMLVMLRHAAPLRPTASILMGSLAVAAITATALALFHAMEATVMIVAWNLGTAALFVGLGSVFGNRMFHWIGARPLSGYRR